MYDILEVMLSASIMVDGAMDLAFDITTLLNEGILTEESKMHATMMCVKIAFLVGLSYYTGTNLI